MDWCKREFGERLKERGGVLETTHPDVEVMMFSRHGSNTL
jgi:hypothetical protein